MIGKLHPYTVINTYIFNRTFAHNMRRYLTERLSRFEAEITFLNMSNDHIIPRFRILQPFGLGSDYYSNLPMSYAYHMDNFKKSFNSDSYPISTLKNEPSVTNLFYVQVINGCLNI